MELRMRHQAHGPPPTTLFSAVVASFGCSENEGKSLFCGGDEIPFRSMQSVMKRLKITVERFKGRSSSASNVPFSECSGLRSFCLQKPNHSLENSIPGYACHTQPEAVPPCFLDQDDDDIYENGQREMTKEEEEIYYRAVSERQGFDVPVFPDTMAIGRIEPIISLREYFAEEIEMTATLSIEDYNKKNGSDYEVVEIIKANYMRVAGFIFYVTYSVKPANQLADFPTTIFQGKVFFKIDPDDIEILICRPKPNEGEKPAEDQVGMRCCC